RFWLRASCGPPLLLEGADAGENPGDHRDSHGIAQRLVSPAVRGSATAPWNVREARRKSLEFFAFDRSQSADHRADEGERRIAPGCVAVRVQRPDVGADADLAKLVLRERHRDLSAAV